LEEFVFATVALSPSSFKQACSCALAFFALSSYFAQWHSRLRARQVTTRLHFRRSPNSSEVMTARAEILLLVAELHRHLEDDSSTLTVLLRKAARLATLVGDNEYRLLFETHLEGLDTTGKSGFRVERWPEGAPPPKWDVIKATLQDRANGEMTLAVPVTEIDRRLHALLREQANPEIARSIAARKALMQAEVPLQDIANRIRNRIGIFVRTVEGAARAGLDNRSEGAIGVGGRIFIGHGRSWIWRDLRDLIADRMRLEWDEFNRESTAGRSTKERLEEILAQASFAFLVMTAEDEHADGTRHARENVIHEIGLFQGRLGFARAIILLEDGCTEFSNVHGLTQIRFPTGDILARSEEVRRVLEREGILPSSTT
jgi:predicted nucleotide-binding protein